MTMLKVNNRPALKTWNGLVNELFHDLEQSLVPVSAPKMQRAYPAANIIENQDGFHAELLAPGRKKENFNLKVENNLLTVSYTEEKTPHPADWKQIRNEFTLGNFSRSFSLDETVQTEGIQARYEDGLLKIFIPKKPQEKPASVTINVQ